MFPLFDCTFSSKLLLFANMVDPSITTKNVGFNRLHVSMVRPPFLMNLFIGSNFIMSLYFFLIIDYIAPLPNRHAKQYTVLLLLYLIYHMSLNGTIVVCTKQKITTSIGAIQFHIQNMITSFRTLIALNHEFVFIPFGVTLIFGQQSVQRHPMS